MEGGSAVNMRDHAHKEGDSPEMAPADNTTEKLEVPPWTALKKLHEMGLILIPMTVKDGDKIPLIEYKGYAEKGQDLATLSGLYKSYKDVKPLHWAVYCINGVAGMDFDCPADYEMFFNDIDTLTVRTPSGGYHCFIKGLTPCKSFKAFGLEFKVNLLCTVFGEGYDLVKDSSITVFEDAEGLIRKKLPKIKIDKGLENVPVTEVISKFARKEKEFHGGWQAFCPIHGDDRTPHLYIYESTNSWYCFKCGKGGDAAEFIKLLKKVNFKEAKRIIEELLGIRLESGKKENTKFLSMFEFPDGRHAEEIIKDGIPAFLIYDPATRRIDYKEKIEFDAQTILPLPLDSKLREALTLPDGVEEYGTLEQLINEITDFALAKFDPVSNEDLFKLILHIFLASWFVPKWMKSYPERFFPAITARGPSETGKKRLLTLGRWLSYRPMYMLKTTKVPTLFRAIDPWDGTLILDEADLTDSSESGDFIEFYNSRADGVPIPRYSTESRGVEWWYSFGLTLTATRKAYTDDGAESRTIVFPSESTRNPEKFDLIPSKDWLEKGKRLQRKLLMFRLKHLHGEIPSNLIIPNIRGFRVRECLLSLQVLGNDDPKIIKNLEEIARVLEKRVIAERASSREGLILNAIYSAITDGAILIPEGLAWMIVRTWKKEDTDVQTPATSKSISENLGKVFSPTEVGRIWRGLGQDNKQQMRHDGKRYKGVLLIINPKRLDYEFKKYVPDAVNVLEKIYGQEKSEVIKPTAPPDGIDKSTSHDRQLDELELQSVPSVPDVPEKPVFTPVTNFTNNNITGINSIQETLPQAHRELTGTTGTAGTPQDITEIERIAGSLKEWEALVNCQPLERETVPGFILWFIQNMDGNIPASRIKEHIWRIKGFTPDSGRPEQSDIKEKSLGTVQIHGKEVPVVEEL
jgi:hypothetical protein